MQLYLCQILNNEMVEQSDSKQAEKLKSRKMKDKG